METNDEFWEMMSCSSDSVLEDQEIIDTRLLSDIPAFEDVTEDSNVSPERDQVRQCRHQLGSQEGTGLHLRQLWINTPFPV